MVELYSNACGAPTRAHAWIFPSRREKYRASHATAHPSRRQKWPSSISGGRGYTSRIHPPYNPKKRRSVAHLGSLRGGLPRIHRRVRTCPWRDALEIPDIWRASADLIPFAAGAVKYFGSTASRILELKPCQVRRRTTSYLHSLQMNSASTRR